MAGVVRSQTYQSAAWRDIDEIYVYVSGAWRTVDQAWTNVNGSWKTIFVNPTREVLLQNNVFEALNPVGGGATASFTLNSNGDAEYVTNPPSASTQTLSNQWRLFDYGRSYECRGTLVSGSFDAAPTFGAWHALSSSRTWSITVGAAESQTGIVDIDIREVGGSTLYTGRISLYAESI